MGMEKKRSLFAGYTKLTQKYFGVVALLLFLFLFMGEFFSPDERDKLPTDCQVFHSDWQQVLENGERLPVDVPGKVQAEFGEVVVLTTTLPQDIHNGANLCFRPIWQDVEIYIDGELRRSYSTVDSRPFGLNSPMRYIFVELRESDAGKELYYQFSSRSKYAGDIRTIYIGDKLSIWTYLVEKAGAQTVIAFFLLLMSIFCILVCAVLKFVYKKPLSLNYLAWTIFFCAFWMLSEIEFRQLLVKNISILSNYAYWSLMMIPLPLLLYINDIQNGRYKKIFFVPVLYSVVLIVVSSLLQILDIAQFVQQIPFIHAGLLTSIACIIGTITIDVFKKRIADYLFVGIGIYGMLFAAVMEMVFYYTGSSLSLGTILAFGLLFLLIMAIIKTGQDLFLSEKKKHQAILAREAQAKFLANMSHEIRTPINAIIGMNEMILRESENETVKDYAQDIQSASEMLLGLVNDVLDFSKIESGQLELVEDTYHLGKLLRDEMLLLRTRAAGKAISTQIVIDEELPSRFWGDELRIKQILTNLLSNAVKYTKQGNVTLKVFFKQKDEDAVDLYFSVIDTGIGIRQEDLSKLFDSFKRLELNKNRDIQGTGLGLNIAKQLVDLMQGRITVESEYGKGSVFTVSIPQKVMDKKPLGRFEEVRYAERGEKQEAKNSFTAPDAMVLVVDDNSLNLSVIKGLLKRTQVGVDLAVSGKECLEFCRSKHYDIILMDHMMPELDGVETLHMLREDAANPNRNTIVVALTANAIAGSREMYLEFGFDDYFTKPIQVDKLDALLLQYLPKKLIHMDEHVDEVLEEACEEGKAVLEEKEPLEDLLYIDRDMGISYCMDSEEFYQEILLEFCKQCEESLSKLEQHFQNRDWEKYAIVAHALKGNTLNIGASNFSRLSLQHELAGKEGNADFIIAEYSGYAEALKKLLKKVEKM